MTTLYKPVLITSAEQAEALPEGVVVIGTRVGVVDKGSRGRWWSGLTQVPAPTVIGGSALVPIEAKEERTRPVQLYISAVHVAPPSSATKPSRRLVTPWEEA